MLLLIVEQEGEGGNLYTLESAIFPFPYCRASTLLLRPNGDDIHPFVRIILYPRYHTQNLHSFCQIGALNPPLVQFEMRSQVSVGVGTLRYKYGCEICDIRLACASYRLENVFVYLTYLTVLYGVSNRRSRRLDEADEAT